MDHCEICNLFVIDFHKWDLELDFIYQNLSARNKEQF